MGLPIPSGLIIPLYIFKLELQLRMIIKNSRHLNIKRTRQALSLHIFEFTRIEK